MFGGSFNLLKNKILRFLNEMANKRSDHIYFAYHMKPSSKVQQYLDLFVIRLKTGRPGADDMHATGTAANHIGEWLAAANASVRKKKI